MNRKGIAVLLMALSLVLLCSSAFGAPVYMDGTAKALRTETVLAPIGGTGKSIDVREGDTIESGMTLQTLKTTVVYADQPGRVAFYGNPGERTEAVSELYGAVAVIDPDSRYMISTSTTQAYDDNENKMVRSGIIVYLVQTEGNKKESGIGQVLQGNFELGDSLNIYQAADHDYTTRIGRGSLSRTDSVKYTGEGSIVSLLAENGAHVEAGDPLFETLDGTFNGLISTGNTVGATTDGVISRISVEQGDHIDKNQAVAEIWPEDAMRVVASIQEMDLAEVNAGDDVEIEFDAFPDQWIKGTIERIASRAISDDENSKNAEYEVVVNFETNLPIRFGMHAQVKTVR